MCAYPVFLIHSSSDGDLGWFPVLAFVTVLHQHIIRTHHICCLGSADIHELCALTFLTITPAFANQVSDRENTL